jgi:RNA polymerase sigma-70 factor (ECF subfamily)
MRPSPEGACDDALVQRAKAGSSAAFSVLVQRHQQAVRAFARRMGGDLVEADDLAQDAFVTAWSRLQQYESQASFRAWVCGVVYRKAMTSRRGVLRGMGRDAAYVETRGWSAGEAVEPAAKTALRRAMSELPADQRAAVALCLAADFSHAEAADALNLPLGTIKSHVNRGRARLLELMGGRDAHA